MRLEVLFPNNITSEISIYGSQNLRTVLLVSDLPEDRNYTVLNRENVI